MGAATPAVLDHAGPEARRGGAPPAHWRDARSGLFACGVAACLAGLAAVLGWRGADTPNVLFRVELFRRAGFAVWDLGWYAGHHVLGYSVLLGPLGAVLGPAGVGLAAAGLAAVSFDRLVVRSSATPRRARAASFVFAAGTVTNVAVGRLAFALGLAFGLTALLAVRHGRAVIAATLSLATALASPVAGAFLALAWLAMIVGGARSWRKLAPLVTATIAPTLFFAVVFPEGGSFPFRWSALVFVLTACAAAAWMLPARLPVARAGAGLYALACVGAFVLPTPLGANVTRLGMYVLAPVLIAFASRRRLLVLVVPILLWWQWSPALDAMVRSGADPSTTAAYYAPLVSFFQQQPNAIGRIEIPLTLRHYEAAFVAPAVPIARGWERQLDILDNPIFYGPGLDARRYHAWLLDNGIQYVALADAELDSSAVAEAAVVRSHPDYLTAVWSNSHWTVWRVVDSPGIVTGPAHLVAQTADSVLLDASGAGTVTVHVRWTPYWSVDGAACAEPAPGGWTSLEVRAAGPLVLHPMVLGDRAQC
jgi:hypothetical protein